MVSIKRKKEKSCMSHRVTRFSMEGNKIIIQVVSDSQQVLKHKLRKIQIGNSQKEAN